MQYDKLIVLDKPFHINGRLFVTAKCDCGSIKKYRLSNLQRKSQVKSCGCYNSNGKKKHLVSRTRLYNIFQGMIKRCYVKTDRKFKLYGKRGITIYKPWIDNPGTFFKWAKENGYKDSLVIDRINQNGNYTPENCRFVTYTENNRNKRNNLYITAFGETKVLAAWIEDPRCLVSRHVLSKRIKSGMIAEIAITKQSKRFKSKISIISTT